MFASERIGCESRDYIREGLTSAKRGGHDIIVPCLDFEDVEKSLATIDHLRAAQVKVPVMAIALLGGQTGRVLALEKGADDYLAWPFRKNELVAQVCMLVRRSHGHAHDVIETRGLRIDIGTRLVEIDGKPVELRHREYQCLEILMLRMGMPVGVETFLQHIYDVGQMPSKKVLDVFISQLRKKLREASDGDPYVETVWGEGYTIRKRPPRARVN
jgi:two-component system cell cycle response regulator CtrA